MNGADVATVSTSFLDAVPLDTPDEQLAEKVAEARRRLPSDEMIAHLRALLGFKGGPDVVLLGLPRTGTSWVFEHFHKSANTAKYPFKEINFLNMKTLFSDRYLASTLGRRNWRVYQRQFHAQHRDMIAAGMIDITIWALLVLIGRRNWHWYDTVMGSGPHQLGMDYTPSNFKMSAATAALLRIRHPKARCAVILRHPLDRHQSHLARMSSPKTKTILPSEFDGDEFGGVSGYLFGERLRRLKRVLGHIEVFYFSDLKDDPLAFLRDFARRVGVSITADETAIAPINAMDWMPTVRYTKEAISALLADMEHMNGIVRKDELAKWKSDADRLYNAALKTGHAEIAGFP